MPLFVFVSVPLFVRTVTPEKEVSLYLLVLLFRWALNAVCPTKRHFRSVPSILRRWARDYGCLWNSPSQLVNLLRTMFNFQDGLGFKPPLVESYKPDNERNFSTISSSADTRWWSERFWSGKSLTHDTARKTENYFVVIAFISSSSSLSLEFYIFQCQIEVFSFRNFYSSRFRI